MKTFHFMAGLPRSGSTLISSILNQNPEIHSGPNSPICGMLYNLERNIITSEQWMAYPKPQVMKQTIFGVLESYYSDRAESIIFDKNREYASKPYFDTLLRIMPSEPRVILPVRSIPDILASFISLAHSSEQESFIDRDMKISGFGSQYKSLDENRCDFLMREGGIIDNCLRGVHNAVFGSNPQCFHLVEYEDFLLDPQGETEKIYDFIGVAPYAHDFNNIENRFKENDHVHGLDGMHDVRRTISKREIDIKDMLTEQTQDRYSGAEFWRDK